MVTCLYIRGTYARVHTQTSEPGQHGWWDETQRVVRTGSGTRGDHTAGIAACNVPACRGLSAPHARERLRAPRPAHLGLDAQRHPVVCRCPPSPQPAITTTIPITSHCRCSRRLTLAALTAPRSESYGPIEKLDVPGVQGAFVLSNVLAVDECEQILRLSEAMGYTEDAPVSLGRNVRPPAPRLRRACAAPAPACTRPPPSPLSEVVDAPRSFVLLPAVARLHGGGILRFLEEASFPTHLRCYEAAGAAERELRVARRRQVSC